MKGNAGGTITDCVPQRSFSASWEFGGAVRAGWEPRLLGLGMHTRSKAARDMFDENAFDVSDEGKQFVTDTGEGWIAADIKGGETEANATARGKATIAFYRGRSPPG